MSCFFFLQLQYTPSFSNPVAKELQCWIEVQSMQRNHLSCMLLRALLLFACSVEMLSRFAMLIGCLKAMKGIHWLIYVVEGISDSKLLRHNVSLFFLNKGRNTIEMWWSDGKITTVLFPGLSPTRPHRTRERGTLVGPGHVSPRICEITNEWFWGGKDKCEIRLAVKHTVHWHFQEKFNILGFSLQYGSIINEHKLLSPFQCGFRSNYST